MMASTSLGKPTPQSDIARSWSEIFRLEMRHRRLTLIIALIMGAVVSYALWYYGYLTPDSVVLFLQSHPLLAPFVFFIVYALAVVCFLPTLPLNLGAGLIWGPFWGGMITVLGASTGAACAFLAARHLAADYLNARFSHRIWNWLREEIRQKGWKAVAFVRINPIFPFGPLSYFFGLTLIGFRDYVLATMLSIVPLSLTFAAVGHSVGSIVLEGDASALLKDLLVVSLAVTTLLFLRMAVRRMTQSSLA